MNPAQQVGDDLQYVRQAVARRERPQQIPTAIAWMVAIYVSVGYTLLDINPKWAGISFLVGGIAMGVLCPILGRRDARRKARRAWTAAIPCCSTAAAWALACP